MDDLRDALSGVSWGFLIPVTLAAFFAAWSVGDALASGLTLVLGKIGLLGSTGGGAAGHRVVRNAVRAVVANAAANFSAVRLGQLWSLILLTSALLPKSLYLTRAFRPRFLEKGWTELTSTPRLTHARIRCAIIGFFSKIGWRFSLMFTRYRLGASGGVSGGCYQNPSE